MFVDMHVLIFCFQISWGRSKTIISSIKKEMRKNPTLALNVVYRPLQKCSLLRNWLKLQLQIFPSDISLKISVVMVLHSQAEPLKHVCNTVLSDGVYTSFDFYWIYKNQLNGNLFSFFFASSFWWGEFYGYKNRICGFDSRGLMQTALEPFRQPGVQETKENVLLSTLLSLLASARGEKERGAEKKKKWREKKNNFPQGQMSWVGLLPDWH